MKGVIFNALEEFIVAGFGPAAYEQILSRCPLHTKEPFVGPGTYPDADLMKIVEASVKHLGLEPKTALRHFGRFLFHELARKYPRFLEGHLSSQTFLPTVESVIHIEVKKIDARAELPKFRFEYFGNTLKMTYSSKRKLCDVAMGMIEGSAEYFGERVEVRHPCCMHKNDEICVFEVAYPSNVS